MCHQASTPPSPPSPIPSPSAEPYVLNLPGEQYPAFEEEYKAYLINNLETLLIGHPPTKWPQQIKAAIADTIIRGRFKYLDDERRIYRIVHNSTLTLGTVSPITPLPRDTQSEKRASVIHDGVCTALNYFLSENIFVVSNERFRQACSSAANFECPSDSDTPSGLGDIATLIRDVAALSTRSAKHTLDILLTAITGMPCLTVELDDEENILGAIRHSRDVHGFTNRSIFKITSAMSEALPPIIAAPCCRWKIALMYRLDYLHKISFRNGHHVADYDVLQALSKIDLAHAILETGVSLKIAGKKICFVAPNGLTSVVTQAIADVYSDEVDVESVRLGIEQKSVYLADADRIDMEASDPHPLRLKTTKIGN